MDEKNIFIDIEEELTFRSHDRVSSYHYLDTQSIWQVFTSILVPTTSPMRNHGGFNEPWKIATRKKQSVVTNTYTTIFSS